MLTLARNTAAQFEKPPQKNTSSPQIVLRLDRCRKKKMKTLFISFPISDINCVTIYTRILSTNFTTHFPAIL